MTSREQEDRAVAQLHEWHQLKRDAEKAALTFRAKYNLWVVQMKAGMADAARVSADDAIQAYCALDPLLDRLRQFEAIGYPATQIDVPNIDAVVVEEPAPDWGQPSVYSSGLDDPSHKGGRRRA